MQQFHNNTAVLLVKNDGSESLCYVYTIGKAAAFVFFVFAEGCKYQRAYIFIPKIAQRILIVLVWNITIHS